MVSNSFEIKKFAELANEWWDKNGKFKLLHDLNILRVSYINSLINIDSLEVLDIGCGGGILSESLSKIKANVTAIDPCYESICVAKKHAEDNSLNINYLHCELEDFLISNGDKKYDLICLMEVVEHVDQLEDFLTQCASLLCHGGILVLSTINRTIHSYIKAILVAERFLNFVPKGTHQWNKFVRPSEITNALIKLKLLDITGLNYNPLLFEWKLQKNKVNTNYFMAFKAN
ncbi:bifunctional 2-polyprenyl-6-hydroxyphenol methylase/3-demethylubiquinol 3-O-methyltransferase UbiG [Anaplasmataceae bacterium AB001_6]|nr:bifunctional 2-polyprenyl-6-hydroxyphenol methylase/3-demethylubiquinol 3-O-methyltransferase UbiG [Anaplasmataceae bacterium AB001_6]